MLIQGIFAIAIAGKSGSWNPDLLGNGSKHWFGYLLDFHEGTTREFQQCELNRKANRPGESLAGISGGKMLGPLSWAFLRYAPFFDPTDEDVGFNKACLRLRQGTLAASIPAQQIAWLPRCWSLVGQADRRDGHE